jgi:hypothetical protein
VIGNVQRVDPAYAELSRIAPTVAYANAGAGQDWREAVRTIGDVLSARDRTDAWLDEYTARVEAVAARHAATIGGAIVALLRFTGSELRIVRGEIFGASILLTGSCSDRSAVPEPAPPSTPTPPVDAHAPRLRSRTPSTGGVAAEGGREHAWPGASGGELLPRNARTAMISRSGDHPARST